MKYCSTICQERDIMQHDILCGSFENFKERSSPNHFRAIYSPIDSFYPRFIWLRMTGTRGSHNVDAADISQYLTGVRSARIHTSSHYGITPERDYETTIVVQHDENLFGGGQPLNLCLSFLLGIWPLRWRGAYVAHAYKYTAMPDPSDYDDTDAKEIDVPILIALDLDTTSLGPLVAKFWDMRINGYSLT
ncbi:hypothetical protein COCCADRAFT_93713 [Bipolaris zeicola 26-R-13]|uniref:Uncharacterized protein n=1 Tax=Cochliobolus carbonum (strain 26-R-13) TaxID=930089 RepID=W6Y3Q7_COCC2|nr:uncharacterized protein COCCADRAFT_93713 [Bipolaris zeicola 26-R-13]EUC34312.1 hypothetical protein COCCADRAFT_93713 [Bipolaris zeicola 26-R-13]